MEKNFAKCVFNQTKRFSAIFFDLDNTLIQTRKADAKTCNKVITLLFDVNFHTIFRTINPFLCMKFIKKIQSFVLSFDLSLWFKVRLVIL